MSKAHVFYISIVVVIFATVAALAVHLGERPPDKLCADPVYRAAVDLENTHDCARLEYLKLNFDKLPRSVISAEVDTVIKYARKRRKLYDSLHCGNQSPSAK